jgi:hypothetical protein
MMKKKSLNVTGNDLIIYIESILDLSKSLDKSQKDELRDIFVSILVLLVSLKKSSNLGTFRSPFIR